MSEYTCDVCRQKFGTEHEVVVIKSSVHDASFMSCRDCNRRSYEPMIALVYGMAAAGKRSAEEVDKWLYDMIVRPSLRFHGVEEETFWENVNAQIGTGPSVGS